MAKRSTKDSTLANKARRTAKSCGIKGIAKLVEHYKGVNAPTFHKEVERLSIELDLMQPHQRRPGKKSRRPIPRKNDGS